MSKTQTEFITVTGISLKEEKEKGWISCVKTNSSSWKLLLLSFSKENFASTFTKLGIYQVQLRDNAGFGEIPKYEITEAKLIVSFEDILKSSQ